MYGSKYGSMHWQCVSMYGEWQHGSMVVWQFGSMYGSIVVFMVVFMVVCMIVEYMPRLTYQLPVSPNKYTTHTAAVAA